MKPSVKLNNSEDHFLSEEKDRIKNIMVAKQHISYRDNWLNIRCILDIISTKLIPFTAKIIDEDSSHLSKEKIDRYNRNLGQKVSIDLDSLSPEQQSILEPTLKHLLDIKVIDYEDFEYGGPVISTRPLTSFLEGNILIKNRDIFEEYHRKISDLVDFIQKDGERRFTKAYNVGGERLMKKKRAIAKKMYVLQKPQLQRKRPMDKMMETTSEDNTPKPAMNDAGTKDPNDNGGVQNITIIEPKYDDDAYKFVVNTDYKNAKVIQRRSNYFKLLISIIKGELVRYEKGAFDYFNYSKRCSIYSGGKYRLTRILEIEDGNLKINAAIKTEFISVTAYNRRVNKCNLT
jgi:hypothetical protein